MNSKPKHSVVYDKSVEEFDIGHCPFKVKVKITAGLSNFSPFIRAKSNISALAHGRKL